MALGTGLLVIAIGLWALWTQREMIPQLQGLSPVPEALASSIAPQAAMRFRPYTQAHAHGHNADPAVAAQIEKAFTGFGRTRMERQFPLNIQAGEFQVTRSDIFIMVYPPKEVQPLARYAVGIVAPDGVSRYVLPVGSTYVVTIADYQIDNLLNLIQAVGEKPGQGTSKK